MEYIILLGLIAIVVIAGLKVFGSKLLRVTDEEGDHVARLEGWDGKAGGKGEGAPRPGSGAPAADPNAPLKADGIICPGGKCPSGFCFVAGTPVETKGGERAIESVHAGDVVLSRSDETGETAYRRVVRTFVTPGRDVIQIALRSSVTTETIGVTPQHPFWVIGRGWVAAGLLDPGEHVVDASGEPVEVAAIAELDQKATVYNFEVEGFHSYFVGDARVWVHNECDDKKLDPVDGPAAPGPQENAVRVIDRAAQALVDGKKGEAVDILTKGAKALRDAAGALPKGSNDAQVLESIAKNFEARARGYDAANPNDVKTAASGLFNAARDLIDRAEAANKAGDTKTGARLMAIGIDSHNQAKMLYQAAVNTDVLMGEGLVETYRAIVNASFDKQIADKYWNSSKNSLRQDRDAINAVFDESIRIMRTEGVPFHEAWSMMFGDNRMWWGDKNVRPKGWPATAFGSRGGGFVNRNDGAVWLRDHPTTKGLLMPFADISRGLSMGDLATIEKGRAASVEALRANDQWDIAKVVLDNLQKSAESKAGRDEAARLKGNESSQWWAAKSEQFVRDEVPILVLTGLVSGGTGWLAKGGATALGWGTRAIRATQIAVELGTFVPTEKLLNQAINDKAQDWSTKALARDYAFTIGGFVVFKAIGRGWQYFRARGGAGIGGELGEVGGTAGEQLAAKKLAEAQRWANELAETAPKPDPVKLAEETARYQARQQQIQEAYDKVMRGEAPHPSGVSADRLKLAVEGGPGGRVPLTFKSPEQYARFQAELKAIFESEGITDATVQQLGSGTTGWRGNPLKEFAGWKPTSDTDFAIFSRQAIQQAREVGAPVNTKIVQGGRYTVFKNGAPGEAGFADTPLGKKLQELGKRWNKEIYGDPNIDGFDFKLNLSDRPFQKAVDTLRMPSAVTPTVRQPGPIPEK